MDSVTSVGATTKTGLEVAADLSFGAFANIFATLSFQASAVSAYIESLGCTYRGLHNASGRGLSLVSAQGIDVAMYYKGRLVIALALARCCK